MYVEAIKEEYKAICDDSAWDMVYQVSMPTCTGGPISIGLWSDFLGNEKFIFIIVDIVMNFVTILISHENLTNSRWYLIIHDHWSWDLDDHCEGETEQCLDGFKARISLGERQVKDP